MKEPAGLRVGAYRTRGGGQNYVVLNDVVGSYVKS